MHRIFISYSRTDYPQVIALKDEIEVFTGRGSCWIDLTGIESDRQFVDVIIDAIDNTEIFLFMYSRHSDCSEWTRKEIEYAYSEKKKIVIVKIDNVPLSKYFRFQFGGHDIIDINDSLQKQKLFDNLCCWCGCGELTGLQVSNESEARQSATREQGSGTKQKNGHMIEILLVITACLVPVCFLIGFPLLVFIHYLCRNHLRTRHPKYWTYVIKVKNIGIRMLQSVDIIFSIFILLVACSGYDRFYVIITWVFLIATLFLLGGSYIKPSLLCLKTKRGALFFFGIPALLYIGSLFLFHL